MKQLRYIFFNFGLLFINLIFHKKAHSYSTMWQRCYNYPPVQKYWIICHTAIHTGNQISENNCQSTNAYIYCYRNKLSAKKAVTTSWKHDYSRVDRFFLLFLPFLFLVFNLIYWGYFLMGWWPHDEEDWTVNTSYMIERNCSYQTGLLWSEDTVN